MKELVNHTWNPVEPKLTFKSVNGGSVTFQNGIPVRKIPDDIIRKNPILAALQSHVLEKTFSFCTYDIMINEFASDGVIDPIMPINIEVNDKENQSSLP